MNTGIIASRYARALCRYVAAHGDDAVAAFVGGLAGYLGAVVYVFGVAHSIVEEVLVEVLLEQGLYAALPAYAGDGVDDYEGFGFHYGSSLLFIMLWLYCCMMALSSLRLSGVPLS